jgi:hypothetical protein
MTPLGKAPVEVARDDVDNVVLTLGNTISLTGRIRFDGEQSGGKPASFGSTRIQLMPVEGMAFNSPGGLAKEDGSFVLENVSPDKYRITVFNLPAGAWLKSVLLGNQDVLDTGLDVAAGAPGPIEIVLGAGGAQVSGVVQDAEQKPAAGALVTLVPDPLKPDRFDQLRMASASQTGAFKLQDIPPGTYWIFAWRNVDSNEATDPELIKRHESKAQRLTLKENSQENLTLSQIVIDAAR